MASRELKAVRWEILRGIKASGALTVPLAVQPIRVATLIDEAGFQAEQVLAHNRTVFLEDRYHDWDWAGGRLRYYSRVASCADVVVVYELGE
ncbi:hypothetical protein [Rubrivivax gelatinosus]|uniref:hypothetical protein n=1 Tax=Rubrivivax gelatinosus TaxID=28068 RepID=UPI0005C1DAEF|nr:hypothetical protein [Rubrivivax gelatinosus]MBG6083152.1 hypothetical protein [Rubrivivax gelatinosus]